MAATTVAIDIRSLSQPDYLPVGVAASTKIPAGALVGLNASGFAINAADASGCKVIGVAPETVDNSGGAAGDLTISPLIGAFSGFKNDATNPCTIAHVNKTVWVVDNQTVGSDDGTNNVKAGLLLGINADGTLRLEIVRHH